MIYSCWSTYEFDLLLLFYTSFSFYFSVKISSWTSRSSIFLVCLRVLVINAEHMLIVFENSCSSSSISISRLIPSCSDSGKLSYSYLASWCSLSYSFNRSISSSKKSISLSPRCPVNYVLIPEWPRLRYSLELSPSTLMKSWSRTLNFCFNRSDLDFLELNFSVCDPSRWEHIDVLLEPRSDVFMNASSSSSEEQLAFSNILSSESVVFKLLFPDSFFKD